MGYFHTETRCEGCWHHVVKPAPGDRGDRRTGRLPETQRVEGHGHAGTRRVPHSWMVYNGKSQNKTDDLETSICEYI